MNNKEEWTVIVKDAKTLRGDQSQGDNTYVSFRSVYYATL